MLPFTLQQLQILKAVATEKNFTKAAKLLYLSQPSLSKQIKVLEQNLGILLFDREKNKISLTENGEIFLQYAERILALCEESCRTLIDLKHGERGNIIIGVNKRIGIYLMPKILTLFAHTHPQIGLKVLINSTRIIVKNIKNRKIDIGIIDDEISQKLKNNLTVENFVKDEFHLIISKSHPFATKKNLTKENLYDLNFITLNSNSNIKNFIDHILDENQIEVNKFQIIMQLNSIEGIKTAVDLGLGAAFIPSSSIEKDNNFHRIKILKIKDVKISRPLIVISNPKTNKSKTFNFFHSELYKLKNNLEN